ncbi:MAG: phosphatase PAP2 family protein, partial [Algoriphagus sp.]
MIEIITKWDEAAFLWLNSFHSEAVDPIVLQLTKTITWIPLYVLVLYQIYRTDPKNTAWILGGVMLTILLSDQVTSGLMKPYFERLRPCHDPRWEGMLHLYGRCGGLYGFVSSHAANTF